MQLWLRYCIDLGYVEEVTGRKWSERLREISRMLRGLSRQLAPFVLIPGSWLLVPDVVAERSVGP